MLNYKVYVHIFPNNKRYVGITKQSLHKRWQNGNGYKGQVVYSAICKYGWHNIEHRLLYDGISLKDAELIEKQLIKEWHTDNPKYGYNRDSGGNLNKVCSEQTIRKLKDSHKGQVPWIKGKHHTEYSKELNRQKHIGKCAWNKGLKFSEESRFKMSVAKKKLVEDGFIPKNAKSIICVETGEIYRSAREAGRLLGLNSSHISSCCTGGRKTTGGLHFKHYEVEMEVMPNEL